MSRSAETPHLPHQAPIEAYGNGGFRFAGMSHRGSILSLPSGVWAWPVARVQDLDEAAFAPVFAEAAGIEMFLLGAGRDPWAMPDALRWMSRDHRIGVEVMSSGPAVRTYNIVLAEGRRVAAGLIAIE